MSDLMLCGVLRMPMPHDPSNLGLIEWMQIKERMAQAANELEERAARIEALERQVKAADALAEALTPFAFFDPDEPDITSDTTQKAWELRYQDRFKDWIDFGEIDAARAALAAYKSAKEGGA